MRTLIIGGFLAFQITGHANVSFDEWLSEQAYRARMRTLENISPINGRPGAVLASPSRENPDYYYHWVRDAALTMNGLGLDRGIDGLPIMFRDFIEFTKINQKESGDEKLGEPKYYVDGKPFTGPWGRPQNDGPALRAGAIIDNLDVVTTNTGLTNEDVWLVVERDLDYVAQNIYSPNFDLWEENLGQHFYTRMVQRWGLVLGSEFARFMGRADKAAWYASQAQNLELLIGEHFRHDLNQIVENLHIGDRKPSGLDAATILALNHTKTRPLIAYADPLVLSTVSQIIEVFYTIYPINQRYSDLGVAIGRYPEDVYDGARFEYGNPWFLTTLAVAEYFFELARELSSNHTVWVTYEMSDFLHRHLGMKVEVHKHLGHEEVKSIALQLVAAGDLYLQRVRFHVDAEGRMSEQMDRHSGYMRSAHDLTWSYVGFLTAVKARELARWTVYGAN